MQSFLKIIHFEDFRQFCQHRDGILCNNEDNKSKTCDRANKRTMEKCPIWKLFKDFNQRRSPDVEEEADKRIKKFRDQESW